MSEFNVLCPNMRIPLISLKHNTSYPLNSLKMLTFFTVWLFIFLAVSINKSNELWNEPLAVQIWVEVSSAQKVLSVSYLCRKSKLTVPYKLAEFLRSIVLKQRNLNQQTKESLLSCHSFLCKVGIKLQTTPDPAQEIGLDIRFSHSLWFQFTSFN